MDIGPGDCGAIKHPFLATALIYWEGSDKSRISWRTGLIWARSQEEAVGMHLRDTQRECKGASIRLTEAFPLSAKSLRDLATYAAEQPLEDKPEDGASPQAEAHSDPE